MSATTMDRILDELNAARQRATYGAVAAVMNVSPRTLMAGRERDQRHSFVVNQKSGMPTEYTAELMHPELTVNAAILRNKSELSEWLMTRGVQIEAELAA